MKRSLQILSLITVLCLLTGCFVFHKEGDSPYYYGNRYDLFRLALNSFPGPREGLGARIDETFIETDNYGREMYIIEIHHAGWFYHNTITNDDSKVNAAYAISQMHDDKKIYYYEDFCFKLFDNNDGLQQSLLEELKIENDCNKPIQMERCSSRLYEDDFAGMENLRFNYNAWSSILNIFGKESQICAITEDANGKELYGVCIEKNGEKDSYFVIYNPETGIDPDYGIMELKSLDFGEELHELKIRNGWNFTDCPGDK